MALYYPKTCMFSLVRGPHRGCAETDHLQKVRFSYRNLTKIQISSTQTPHMIRYVFAGAKKIRKKSKH